MAKKKTVPEGRGGQTEKSATSSQLKKLFPILLAVVAAFVAGYVVAPSGGGADAASVAAAAAPAAAAAAAAWDGALVVPNASGAPLAMAGGMLERVSTIMETRLEKLLEGTFTQQCRDEVRNTFEEYLAANLKEAYLPFEQYQVPSECSKRGKDAKPSGPSVAAADVRLCYLFLVHELPEQVVRTMEALQEAQHHFVVHVDGKAASEATHAALVQYAASRSNVHVLGPAYRTNVSWGGFNVVQGTLNGMRHASAAGLDLDFHWLVTVSGYTYPLMSNADIRARLAGHPTDTNFFEVAPQGNKPAPRTWHHFVECDNRMRRVWRLPELRGVTMYAGSQWFIASKAFVEYAAPAAAAGWPEPLKQQHGVGKLPDTFAVKYAKYGRHTMVADENYFSTVLKASPFCGTHVNTNECAVQFDQYEHQKPTHKSRPSANKCLMPNPNHCGRSPTTTTLGYLPVLDLADKLFARKFVPSVDSEVLDAIDLMRSRDKLPGAVPPRKRPELSAAAARAELSSSSSEEDEGECADSRLECREWAASGECGANAEYMAAHCPESCGTCPSPAARALEAAPGEQAEEEAEEEAEEAAAQDEEAAAAAVALAKAAEKPPNQVTGVVLALATPEGEPRGGWGGRLCVSVGDDPARGAMAEAAAKLEACAPNARREAQTFDAAPCSHDGALAHDPASGALGALKGTFSAPFCQLTNTASALCLDVAREQVKAGASIIPWRCQKTKWNQLFSFAADGSGQVFISIPLQHHRDQRMCLEAAAPEPAVGTPLKLNDCDPNEPRQRFRFLKADAPPMAQVA